MGRVARCLGLSLHRLSLHCGPGAWIQGAGKASNFPAFPCSALSAPGCSARRREGRPRNKGPGPRAVTSGRQAWFKHWLRRGPLAQPCSGADGINSANFLRAERSCTHETASGNSTGLG